MNANFDAAFVAVLKHEGGFVNHPSDPGGMTNLGVTAATWAQWTGRATNEKEMRSLTPDLVKPLYKARYWDVCRCDELPDGVDYAVFDLAVNSGPKRAIVTLQRALGVMDDGVIGPVTIKAANTRPPKQTIENISAERLGFLQRLPTFKVFGKGWSRRVAEVEIKALAIA